MTLRTPRPPRRRISPQTKRRYRAIKGFFRRALGSSSQPDLQITSSIAVNVTDIKHKIIRIEKQLNEVSKQCRDITLDNSFRKDSQRQSPVDNSFRKDSLRLSPIDNSFRKDSQRQSPAPKLKDETSYEEISLGTQLEGVETELIYKQAKENNYVPESDYEISKLESTNKMNDFYDEKIPKLTKINRSNDSDITPNYRKHKTKSVYENFASAYSTSSFHSLSQHREMFYCNPSCSGDENEKRNRGKVINDHHKDKKYMEHLEKANHESYQRPHRFEEEEQQQCTKNRKPKRILKQLDQDFITDIIRRQYKPVKLFGTRESDLSQISAPVCRDLKFYHTGSNHVQEDPLQRGCCCGAPHYTRYAHHSDHSDIRSVRDARLYSVKKNTLKHRKKYADAYNDSEIYDLVPVKEKSSPKSRRKFYEDNMRPSGFYKEVPPSPRSQRPRLNLKAQNYEGYDDNMDCVRNPRKIISPKRTMRPQETEEYEENYHPSEMQQMEKYKQLQKNIKCHGPVEIQREMGIMNSQQFPELDIVKNTATVENPTQPSLNKTQETVLSADKTNKALCEIKDILQTFLQEIKRETSLHSGKSEISTKINENCDSPPNEVKERPISVHNLHYKSMQLPVGPTPYMTPFGHNTCCYPMMPVCPINYMQNGFQVPSTGFTCNNCASPKSNENLAKNYAENETLNCETDELIKEIYKFVSTSPKFCRKQNDSKEFTKTDTTDIKVLTSRSAGGSTAVRRCDIKVGTPKINGVSKSCEAIRSKTSSDVSSSDTTTSYSDSVLDKLSLEATQSASGTELSEMDKAKRNKLAKVLKLLGLRKKKKKDAIKELSESESTIEVEVKKKPPLRQNLTNYSMHGQEYARLPDAPHYGEGYRPPYNPDEPYDKLYSHRMQQSTNENRSPKPQHHPGQGPTAPPYPQSYEGFNQMHPQLPLCLKEIEVKSIGCQSERKMSFFRKITRKAQQEAMHGEVPKNCSTQTAQNKPKLVSWKNTEAKLLDRQSNPYAYGFKTQKKLAEGDMNMRNAMLKKLFHKRNPFSPGNLILRTLLGKDKSSFGNPPAMYKPRMFL